MTPNTFLSLSLAFFTLLTASQAIVPPSETFKYTNEGDLGEYVVEYNADYRTLPIATFPFQFCFYNTTPDTFLLGLRMGNRRSESTMRWIWDANRGRPVAEKATLTFASDGNLVLADADGTVAWQTATAGKDVVGLRLLPNGNLVLYDATGKYIWQSFDHPTDTILVGQSIRAAGPTVLTSRLWDQGTDNGLYSFVMEKDYWGLYFQVWNSTKVLYYKSAEFGNGKDSLTSLEFYVEPVDDQNHAFELGFRLNLAKSGNSGSSILTRPKYNSTYSMLRIDIDGNLRMYTYDEHVDYRAWEVTFVVFDRDEGETTECKLPRRCGSLGVCESDQCVACPNIQRPGPGLVGWDFNCSPPMPPPCKAGVKLDYFKVDGVDHYTSEYSSGTRLSLKQCQDRCNKDCKCRAVFYRAESSRCLLVNDLGTFVKVENSDHAGYIKVEAPSQGNIIASH